MQDEFRDDLLYWVRTDLDVAERLLRLIEETLRDPIRGIGKPEPLRNAEGCWSRRLTSEHRIVYRVTAKYVDFLQARYHYKQ